MVIIEYKSYGDDYNLAYNYCKDANQKETAEVKDE